MLTATQAADHTAVPSDALATKKSNTQRVFQQGILTAIYEAQLEAQPDHIHAIYARFEKANYAGFRDYSGHRGEPIRKRNYFDTNYQQVRKLLVHYCNAEVVENYPDYLRQYPLTYMHIWCTADSRVDVSSMVHDKQQINAYTRRWKATTQHCFVAKSSILNNNSGWGCFARQDIAKGDIVDGFVGHYEDLTEAQVADIRGWVLKWDDVPTRAPFAPHAWYFIPDHDEASASHYANEYVRSDSNKRGHNNSQQNAVLCNHVTRKKCPIIQAKAYIYAGDEVLVDYDDQDDSDSDRTDTDSDEELRPSRKKQRV